METIESFEKALQKQIKDKSYNGYTEFEECAFCTSKTTTSGCFTCNIFKIKGAIAQLNVSILTRMKSEPVLFIFNEKYKQYIKKYALIELLPLDCIKWTYNLENDYVGCVVNKNWFYEEGNIC